MTDQPRSIHERIMQARCATGDGRDGLVQGDATTKPAGSSVFRRLVLGAVAASVLVGAVGAALWQAPVFAQDAGQPSQTAPKPKTVPKPKTNPQPAAQKQQVQPQAQQAAPAPAPAAAPGSAAPSDLFLAHATQVGVKTCAATYAGLGRMLTNGTPHMVQTQTAKTDPDRHSLQALVGMTFQGSADGNYTGPAAGLVFAAPTAQGCEGTMVRVVPFAQDCQAAATLLPKGSQPLDPLSGMSVYALPGGGQAMLMPAADNSCVALSVIRSGG